MELADLVKSLQDFEGVSRKKSIESITNKLKEVYNVSGETLLDFGDDASAIDLGDGNIVLFAADGIWGKLMDADPYWAGYCSVLVNVNDIAAMGAKPIAMVNILSINNENIANGLIDGIKDGCKKFNVPMVGGHLHPDTEYNALDVAIVGIAKKDKIITSFGANVGDKIIVAIDLDGRQHPSFNLNWDTTYFKDEKLVQDQLIAMKEIAEKDLVTGGKDISNPGTLGTLEMLLESSGVGGRVELNKIPRNEDVNWEEWLKSYPGAGFVLTAKEKNTEELINLLDEVSITASIVGEVISEKKLYLSSETEEMVLFDQDKNPVLKIN
ncbi:MAG: methanogenesis marker 2 protein [Methanobrevibacter arboriphilus]|uniref:Methanogenesis marker 2 protein n=2 Tax=Methanobrevibacter arboriphilus TaxID=39441 RepID=A0ACA8R3B7_METAZ|nr:methanogenesis marker 2 protein [Methanobrevibacter arboriphilus]MBF4468268.1 methanogenesis marker 2 protein [Methanobrevibacter arboriphilus]BBL61702.1 methanogenesis marker 2 protein [Methanobrevibacter arboriphilus]GLI12718.1 methanogenesis marker 2 protein [Methanobrevibacter arboriphilus]